MLMVVMAAAQPHRRFLFACALGSYVVVFFALLLWERPGLGIAHFFYVSIALLALASGPQMGVLGGLLATVLFALGVVLNPHVPTEFPTVATALRLMTFTGMGLLVGFYAQRNRVLVDELRILAERDFLTGLPNTRSFEAAISRRLESGRPFALLIGDMDGLKQINDERGHTEGNDALQRLGEALGTALGPDDDVARVGGDEFAVLTSARSSEEARRAAEHLEKVAAAHAAITFGWASFPQEGENALTLYRAADERLYARKLIRGGRRGDVAPRLTAVPTPREALLP
jgi:diguanylate cyclase (GGDEF)-like protein